MSPPDLPGIPSRNLPPRKDPRRDSPGPFDAVIPEAARVPVEVAQAPVPRQSVFSALVPDKRVVNICSVILTLFTGGGAAVAMNRGAPDESKAVALDAKVEAQKGELNQALTRVRLIESRLKDLESMTATAFSKSPCVSKKVGARTELVCGGYELEGFPAVRATIKSERMDPPTFSVELSDGTQPTPWPKP